MEMDNLKTNKIADKQEIIDFLKSVQNNTSSPIANRKKATKLLEQHEKTNRQKGRKNDGTIT